MIDLAIVAAASSIAVAVAIAIAIVDLVVVAESAFEEFAIAADFVQATDQHTEDKS